MGGVGLGLLSMLWAAVSLILILFVMAISVLSFASWLRLMGFYGAPTWGNIFEPWRVAFDEISSWWAALSSMGRQNPSSDAQVTPPGAENAAEDRLFGIPGSGAQMEGVLTDEEAFGTYYEELGVPLNAPNWEIRKAYRRLAKKCHPDRNPSRRTWAEARMKRINEAYQTLIDPELRKQYDLNMGG